MMTNKWHVRFLRMARELSTWSKDPSKQIGVIAVGENRKILSTGYNGFPIGIEDTEERYINREEKYKYIVHGEKNCIYNACLNGISLAGSTMYVWGLPVCKECAKAIIQVGVKEVVIPELKKPGRECEVKWHDEFEVTKDLFNEVGIKITYVEEYELREPVDTQWSPS